MKATDQIKEYLDRTADADQALLGEVINLAGPAKTVTAGLRKLASARVFMDRGHVSAADQDAHRLRTAANNELSRRGEF